MHYGMTEIGEFVVSSGRSESLHNLNAESALPGANRGSRGSSERRHISRRLHAH